MFVFSFLSMRERPRGNGQQGSSPSLLIVHVKGQTLGDGGRARVKRAHTHQSYANTRHFLTKRCSLNITLNATVALFVCYCSDLDLSVRPSVCPSVRPCVTAGMLKSFCSDLEGAICPKGHFKSQSISEKYDEISKS